MSNGRLNVGVLGWVTEIILHRLEFRPCERMSWVRLIEHILFPSCPSIVRALDRCGISSPRSCRRPSSSFPGGGSWWE